MQTILVLKANPKTTSSLALDREVRTIREALQLPANNDKFLLESRGAVRAKDLQGILRELQPQILHFSGHGSGNTGLIFETDQGEEHNISGDALADLVEQFKQQIECIVLNACYSEVQAQAIAQNINYVIGMDRDVLDEAAIAFSHGFYTALRHETDITKAHQAGQWEIQLQMSDKVQKHRAEIERKAVYDPEELEAKNVMTALHLIPHIHEKFPLNVITKPQPVKPSQTNIDSLVGHADWVRSLCFSADGKLLISSSNDKTIRVWDFEARQLKHLLIGHRERIKAIGISPNGECIVSGSADSKIKLWKTSKIQQKQTSEDFKTATVSSSDLTLVNSLPVNDQVFATGNGNGKIKLWDVQTGKWQQSFRGHSSSVLALAFSSDGQTLVSGSYGKSIKIWGKDGDLSKCRHCISNAHLSSIFSLAISPDDRILISAGKDHTIKRWYLSSGTKTESNHILKGHAGRVWCVAISPDGQKIASASADYTIKIWDLHTGKLLQTLTDHVGEIRTVAFSPDGKWLASGGDDLEIKLWQM